MTLPYLKDIWHSESCEFALRDRIKVVQEIDSMFVMAQNT
jgi:hypothetical protein